MGPDQFAQQIVQAGQVPVLVSEVVRGKALALVLERAKVTDESGRPVDLESLREDSPTPVLDVDTGSESGSESASESPSAADTAVDAGAPTGSPAEENAPA